MSDYLGREPKSDQDEPSLSDDQQFGLIDVIEAFTAMRQEWRGQSRETRAMVQTLEASRNDFVQLEQRLAGALTKIQVVAAEATSDETSRRLAETIAEMDQHILRAVNATSRTSLLNQLQFDTQSLQTEIAATVQQLGFIRRWFCRPALQQVDHVLSRWVQSQASRTDDASQRGLQMLVDRVQRLMQDQQIQRLETLGKPFDAETMNAIEAVSTSTAPTGSVVEQLSPGYTWCGRLIRYAQVRIAR
jgi:molecular chaperone GrpE